MTFFDCKLNTYVAKMSDIQRFKLPFWCYEHINNFCKKYFKNKINDTVVFPDQTYLPNKLKFNYKYRKGILIDKNNLTNRYINIAKMINNPDIEVTIHVAQGIARLNTQSRRRLNHLLLVGHSYVIPVTLINDQPFLKVFKKPFRILIEIPLRERQDNIILNTVLIESTITPKFAFIDCEMAQTFKRSGRDMCLASVSVVDEEGKVMLDTLVSPIDRVKNYVYRKTGLSDRKLQGKLDERQAISIVHRIAKDYVLVGSDLRNDLKVLRLRTLPNHRKFDIAVSQYLRITSGIETQFMGLKNLSLKILGENVQDGFHTSLEDAMAVFKIFKKHKRNLVNEWKATVS